MRTATGLAIDAIERAQDSLLVAYETGQVRQGKYDLVFDLLLRAKLTLVED